MSVIFVSPPGAEYGPCEVICAHLDCLDLVLLAGTLCTICNSELGYNRAITKNEAGEKVHELCLILQIEEENAP